MRKQMRDPRDVNVSSPPFYNKFSSKRKVDK